MSERRFVQNLEQVVQDLVTENAALQSRVQEVTGLQQQLTRKEGELSRAEKTIRREQQQREQVDLMCVTCSVCGVTT